MPFRAVLGEYRHAIAGHQTGAEQELAQCKNRVREALGGPYHQLAAVLKTQQPVETIMIQMMEEKMVQRGDAVVRLHAASMGFGRLRLVSLKLTRKPL